MLKNLSFVHKWINLVTSLIQVPKFHKFNYPPIIENIEGSRNLFFTQTTHTLLFPLYTFSIYDRFRTRFHGFLRKTVSSEKHQTITTKSRCPWTIVNFTKKVVRAHMQLDPTVYNVLCCKKIAKIYWYEWATTMETNCFSFRWSNLYFKILF